ncbi:MULTISPECIES: XisH family protein [unclassified Okeania]|uniref:XisH family protein n=1 Tax=unclassified Okeania TaxID=2634635 RepID=UPI0013BAEE7E|nr:MULTISPECIES: XisH family protein [unclassified Okeania]NEP06747.1 fatty-acid synthase [Okeania sp. SIO4D6]NEP43411.1 fatty-acid synthase [Okeania sp. SIO2H7]NET15382.1 fatty-acid synthase [Okeania sp. SIO1H6]NEP74222.1 fatty-acid synthase [Okeania sp. SIO2G5]NEP95099.1 fatty-acid synthase [Okeania sp. SIO2F5]
MPAKDFYHDIVKNALIKDGWTITNDPYILSIGKRDLFVDLGVDKLLSAEKGLKKIAVEIKSFTSLSRVNDLEKALGQYILYYDIIQDIEPERLLYLAITESIFEEFFTEPIGQILLKNQRLSLITFDAKQEVICQWIS